MCYDYKVDETKREKYKLNPIYNTDFSKPVSEIIEDVRNRLYYTRGTLHDICYGTGWKDRVEHVIGLLTCGLVALHNAKEEIKKFENLTKNQISDNDRL